MIRFNLRPGDQVRVGDTVFRFVGKEAGRSKFEVAYSGGGVARRQDVGIGSHLALGADAFFVVEKRSGRSSRIALQAAPNLAVARILDTAMAMSMPANKNRLPYDHKPR
jgi:hypothetical protein